MSLISCYKDDVIEIGVDEAGRGPLFGRVYAGAVIWPRDLITSIVKDSKKYLKEKDRESAYNFIIEHAIAYGIGYVEPDEIDDINIYKSVIKAMHTAIKNVHINPDIILVDGDHFNPFMDQYGKYPEYVTIVKGDDKYYSIAGGSVLAKVEHDRYINDMCDKYPILERYDLRKNKGYGSPKHMESIQKYGITQFHRQSFKCCQGKPIVNI